MSEDVSPRLRALAREMGIESPRLKAVDLKDFTEPPKTIVIRLTF